MSSQYTDVDLAQLQEIGPKLFIDLLPNRFVEANRAYLEACIQNRQAGRSLPDQTPILQEVQTQQDWIQRQHQRLMGATSVQQKAAYLRKVVDTLLHAADEYMVKTAAAWPEGSTYDPQKMPQYVEMTEKGDRVQMLVQASAGLGLNIIKTGVAFNQNAIETALRKSRAFQTLSEKGEKLSAYDIASTFDKFAPVLGTMMVAADMYGKLGNPPKGRFKQRKR